MNRSRFKRLYSLARYGLRHYRSLTTFEGAWLLYRKLIPPSYLDPLKHHYSRKGGLRYSQLRKIRLKHQQRFRDFENKARRL